MVLAKKLYDDSVSRGNTAPELNHPPAPPANPLGIFSDSYPNPLGVPHHPATAAASYRAAPAYSNQPRPAPRADSAPQQAARSSGVTGLGGDMGLSANAAASLKAAMGPQGAQLPAHRASTGGMPGCLPPSCLGRLSHLSEGLLLRCLATSHSIKAGPAILSLVQ